MDQDVLKQIFDRFDAIDARLNNADQRDNIDNQTAVYNVTGLLQTVLETSGTTQLDRRKAITPKSLYDQMFVYYDPAGPTYKLYAYYDDGTGANRGWKSCTLT